MCGIAGWVGRPKPGSKEAFETFVTSLLVNTQIRGPHATGVAGYLGANRSVLGKGPVDARNFVRTPVWKRALESRSLIGHCRYATHGSPMKNENNHPFESGKWALIHNGVIHGHEEIARKQDVKLATECDSEVILRVFARGARKGGGPVAGLQRFVDAVRGFHVSYAVALLDRTTGTVRLLRDSGSPCAIARMPALGIVCYASTPEILKRAMEETQKAHEGFPLLDGAHGWECRIGRVYVLSPSSLEVDHENLKWPEGQETFDFRYRQRTATSATPTSVGSTGELVYVCDLCSKDERDCRCEEETSPSAN
jgi:glucosamine--fructose-6-phosphate aminotransferase (isomerizing)